MVTSPAPPQLTPGTGQPSFLHPNLTHPPSFSQRKPPPLPSQHPLEKPLGAGWSRHIFYLALAQQATNSWSFAAGREHVAPCPSAWGSSPCHTDRPLCSLEILPSWALEMSQGPSVPPWEGETGRHGEGTLRALLSSWEFVSFSFWRHILNHIYVFLQS